MTACFMLQLLETVGHYAFSNTVLLYIKCTLVQALRLCTGHTAYIGSRGIALLFHDNGTRRR
jgi:hypothetical protein